MVANSDMHIKPNSRRFLDAFNRIEGCLRRAGHETRRVPFYALVDKASKSSSVVGHFSTDLKEFADLRNAIVHESTNGHVIAEPNDDSVRHIEHIASILLDPPTVIPLFQKVVSTLRLNDSAAEAVKLVFQQSFSQIPIFDNKEFMALLTVNTIVRWLGSGAEADTLSLSEITIGSILQFSEDRNNYCFLGTDATIFDVLSKFHLYEKDGKRLDAIMITQNGKPTETLLGIITVWDLPQIYRILEQ